MRQLNSKSKFKQFPTTDGLGKSKWTIKRNQHPYLRIEFWLNPLNQFWNTDMYSQESKEYFNNCITAQQNKIH